MGVLEGGLGGVGGLGEGRRGMGRRDGGVGGGSTRDR